MKLIVIRHGETILNKEDRLQGCKGPNVGLNDEGKRMVERLREHILVMPDIIYASPLKRTQETAHLINMRFRLPIINTVALVERDFGTLSGKLRSEIDSKLVESDLEGRYDYRPYGGESVNEVRRRVQGFIDLLRSQREQTIMIVTHRGVIRILYDLYPESVAPEVITPASQHVFSIE